MIRKLLRVRSIPESSVWFVAEYELAAVKHREPKAEALPGLIFLHHLDPEPNTATGRFIAYWESREAFEASQAPLEKSLGEATLRREAWVRRVDVRKESHFKRLGLYIWNFLLFIGALFGLLTALQKHYDWLFEEPEVVLDLEKKGPLNLMQGSKLSTGLIFTNQRPTSAAQVSALRATLQGKLLDLPYQAFKIVEGGSFPLRLEVPELPLGRYELNVRWLCRSGLLKGWRPRAMSQDVRVWSWAPQIELGLESVSLSREKVNARLLVGDDAPQGLDCQATLTAEPRVRFGLIKFPHLLTWPDPSVSPEGQVSTQTWTTPPQKEFSDVRFSLYLDGQAAQGWPRVAEHLSLQCSKRVEKEQE